MFIPISCDCCSCDCCAIKLGLNYTTVLYQSPDDQPICQGLYTDWPMIGDPDGSPMFGRNSYISVPYRIKKYHCPIGIPISQ